MTRLVDRDLAQRRPGRARRSARPPRAARPSSRRARGGRCAAPRPAPRRAASCSRCTRTSSCAFEPWKRSIRIRSASSSSLHCDQAAVAEPEQVLGRVEAEGRGDPGARDLRRSERLGGVLDDRETELGELRERRGPSEQVDGHDRLRLRRDPACDVLGVEIERRRIDLGEHRRRADPGDRLGRRVERERRDRSPRPRARCPWRRARSRGHRCRWRRRPSPGRRGSRRLRARRRRRSGRRRTGRSRARRANACLQLRNQRRVLRLDVDEGDLHGRKSLARLGCGLSASPQRASSARYAAPAAIVARIA